MNPSLYTKTVIVDDAIVAVSSLLVDVSALKNNTCSSGGCSAPCWFCLALRHCSPQDSDACQVLPSAQMENHAMLPFGFTNSKNKSIWLALNIKSHGVCHLLIFLNVFNGLFPTRMNGIKCFFGGFFGGWGGVFV